jgi:hypothetical protein
MMFNKDRKDEEELAHLFEALAESVLESSDAELLNEIRAEGQDPDAVAQRGSQLIQAAIKAAAERKRREARQAYEASVASLKAGKYKIPAGIVEQRTLLGSVFGQNPDVGRVLTLQHRALKTLSDADVKGYLAKLGELGFLDDMPDREGG